MPANAPPEMQAELRRQWYLQQQQLINAQAAGIRPNPGLGRGLVIPPGPNGGGPNGRPMAIRPNTGTNALQGNAPLRLSNGVTATPEQLQQLINARLASQNANNPQTPQQMQRMAQARALQAAHASAQAAGANGASGNSGTEFLPFTVQTNAGVTQSMTSYSNANSSSIASRKSCSE
jgi:hypothetical protein